MNKLQCLVYKISLMTEASSLIVTSSNCGLCTLTISHLDFDICLAIIVIYMQASRQSYAHCRRSVYMEARATSAMNNNNRIPQIHYTTNVWWRSRAIYSRAVSRADPRARNMQTARETAREKHANRARIRARNRA